MAFDSNSFGLILQSISGHLYRAFAYKTTDSGATILEEGYFNDAVPFGLGIADHIIAVSLDGISHMGLIVLAIEPNVIVDLDQETFINFEIATEAEAIAGTNNAKIMTPLRVDQGAVYGTYTPSAPNTYPYSMYEDFEWDRLSALGFLSTQAMKDDPLNNDCGPGLQDALDFITNRASWQGDTPADTNSRYANEAPMKRLDLGGRSYLVDGTGLVVTGAAPGTVRQGRALIERGALVVGDSWAADQTSYAQPLLEFGANTQGCGISRVRLDMNGQCSGILINTTEAGNSKIWIDNNVIVNYANPNYPLQSDLYSNCVSIGTGHSASPIPIRFYELNQAHPYGLRVGAKTVTIITTTAWTTLTPYIVGDLVVANGSVFECQVAHTSGIFSDDKHADYWDAALVLSSTTARISGNHIRQWEFGRDEMREFDKRTGIGIWLACSDLYMDGNENNVSDCLKSLQNDGHSNTIKALHTSPSGGGVLSTTATQWLTGTGYVVGNYVVDSGIVYRCIFNHTSGILATDVASLFWTVQEREGEYNVNNAPTPDINLIGTEQTNGHNIYIGNYHERMMWLRDTRATIIGQRFPRSAKSTDGNTTAIMFDATSADQNIGSSGAKLIIDGNQHDGDLDLIAYREVDGNFDAKVITADVLDANICVSASTHAFLSGSDAGGDVIRALSSNANSSKISFSPADPAAWVTSTGYVPGDNVKESGLNYICLATHTSGTFATDLAAVRWLLHDPYVVRFGHQSNHAEIRMDATPIFQGDLTKFNFTTTAGAATALQNGGVQVIAARQTGWSADTGTDKRTANATYSGTAEIGYTQATIQTLMDAVEDATQTIKSLKADLTTHGLIGS